MLYVLEFLMIARGAFYTLLGLTFLLAPIAWFVVSLTAFIKLKYRPNERKVWTGNLIASSIVLGVIILFALFIALIVYAAQDAVIYM